MQQWREAKSKHRDALLFFRVGDFYELFHQDAEEGAKLLGLTLTSRNSLAFQLSQRVGVQFSFVDSYDSEAQIRGARSNNDAQLFFGVVGTF